MKCLSVKQPWANLIASGSKTIEMRTWRTHYRGPLLIVSSKQPKIEPIGCAVAFCHLIDCRQMIREDENASHTPFDSTLFSWVLDTIRLCKPIPIKGELGIYERWVEESDLVFIIESD